MSTGGAATNAIIKTLTAVRRVGAMMTPNQPTYKRFSMLVIQLQNVVHEEVNVRRDRIIVIKHADGKHFGTEYILGYTYTYSK